METSLDHIFQVIGGVGLFLLGMVIMTDGLKFLAGNRMRTALMNFTKTPTSGALTGMLTTIMLQSSSATTVAAVGFVGVGLMQFKEAIGIILGANVGTTFTGWLVVLFGFKFNLAEMVLPLIFFGMILKFFFKNTIATVGYTIAGFGLIFLAITFMQAGMKGFEGIITPDYFPNDSIIGRLELVALGMLVTFITQASSAGVAATLSMLFAHMISFEQAAALVIGMDIGTAGTALLATIGGNTDAKRTGFSHLFYNFLSGLFAFLLITPYVYFWNTYLEYPLIENGEIALVAFHTFFNLCSIIIILPFTKKFALLVEKLIPSDDKYLFELDDELPQKEPKLAIVSLQQALQKTFMASLLYIEEELNPTKEKTIHLDILQKNVDQLQIYIDKISFIDEKEKKWEELISLLHCLNHLERLLDKCEEIEKTNISIVHFEELAHSRAMLMGQNENIIKEFTKNNFYQALEVSLETTKKIDKELSSLRDAVIVDIAKDTLENYKGMEILSGIKWLSRINKHIDRFIVHYEEAFQLSMSKN